MKQIYIFPEGNYYIGDALSQKNIDRATLLELTDPPNDRCRIKVIGNSYIWTEENEYDVQTDLQ